MYVQRLVGISGGPERPTLGEASHSGGHRLGGPYQLEVDVRPAAAGELPDPGRQARILFRVGDDNTFGRAVCQRELTLVWPIGDGDHPGTGPPGRPHNAYPDSADAF